MISFKKRTKHHLQNSSLKSDRWHTLCGLTPVSNHLPPSLSAGKKLTMKVAEACGCICVASWKALAAILFTD